jgi:hypothetical protein
MFWDVALCRHVEVVHFNVSTRRYSGWSRRTRWFQFGYCNSVSRDELFKMGIISRFCVLPIQAVNIRLMTETRVRARVGSCGICAGRSDTGAGFFSEPFGFSCQYHSSVSIIPVSVSFQCQYHSSVSIIPVLLHIHSCVTWGWNKGPAEARRNSNSLVRISIA